MSSAAPGLSLFQVPKPHYTYHSGWDRLAHSSLGGEDEDWTRTNWALGDTTENVLEYARDEKEFIIGAAIGHYRRTETTMQNPFHIGRGVWFLYISSVEVIGTARGHGVGMNLLKRLLKVGLKHTAYVEAFFINPKAARSALRAAIEAR